MISMKRYMNSPASIKASFWYIISRMMQKGVAFITIPFFTRLMTTEQYGQVTIYLSWLEITTIFATLNLFYGVYNNALVKYPEDRETMTSSMQGLCTTLTIMFFIVYYVFHQWINKLTGLATLQTCMLFIEVLFIPAFRFWSTMQRFQYKYRALIILSMAISILTPLMGIPAVLLSSDKGTAKIITGVLAQLIIAIPIYMYIFRNGKVFFKKEYWKFALVFNLPLIPHYLSSVVLNQSDRIMIDSMCGTDKAGIYGLAYLIGSLAIIFSESVMHSYTPWIYQRLKTEKFADIRTNTRYIVVFIGFVTIALVTLAPEFVLVLGGGKYAEGVWIVAPISASIFFRFLYSLYGNIEFYYEENYFIMIASVVCAILNIILNYIFIKFYGYLAAGYTTLACFMIYAFSHYVFSKHVIKKHTKQECLYDDRFIFVVSILVVILCIAMMVLFDLPIIRYSLIAAFLVGSIVYRKRIIDLVMIVRNRA